VTAVSSGVERKVDRLGRIVIPSEMRDRLGLHEGDHVDIAVRDCVLVLTPMIARCSMCGRPQPA
jgi:AbrB family looped-hinge helix DNA binding protein